MAGKAGLADMFGPDDESSEAKTAQNKQQPMAQRRPSPSANSSLGSGKLVRKTYQVPADVHVFLKQYATSHGITMFDLVREILTQGAQRLEQGQGHVEKTVVVDLGFD